MISSPAVRLPGGKYRAGSSNRQSLLLIHVTTEVFGIEGGRGGGEAGGKMGEGREDSKKEEEREGRKEGGTKGGRTCDLESKVHIFSPLGE